MVGLIVLVLLVGLDLNGWILVVDGEIGGFGFVDVVGGDFDVDRIINLFLDIELKGLDEVLLISGVFIWCGEGFSLIGVVDMVCLLVVEEGVVLGMFKGNCFSFGFDGQVKVFGEVDGVVCVQIVDLCGLMVWMG